MVSNDDTLVENIQNIDTVDLDDFYIGCDSRISLSSTIDMDDITYWINRNSALIAMRWYSLQGTAVLGAATIDFGGNDILGIATGINSISESDKVFTKIISLSDFSYSESNNCFKGFIVDLAKSPETNLTSTANVITDLGTNLSNVWDDDLTTYHSCNHGSGGALTWLELLKLDYGFDAERELHCIIDYTESYADCQGSFQTSSNGTDWDTRISFTADSKKDYHNIALTFRYVRIYAYGKSGMNAAFNTLDLSVF